MSPVTSSTPGSVARSAPLLRLRTRARSGTPCADRRRTTAPPLSPLAPVISNISGADSELAHHRRHVEDPPVFADQSVAGESARVGVVGGKRLAGGGHAHELAAVCPLHAAKCNDLIALGNHELRSELQIRERGDEHAKECLEPFAVAGELRWKRAVVIRAIRSDQLVGGLDVVTVHHPVVELLEPGFVALCSGEGRLSHGLSFLTICSFGGERGAPRIWAWTE